LLWATHFFSEPVVDSFDFRFRILRQLRINKGLNGLFRGSHSNLSRLRGSGCSIVQMLTSDTQYPVGVIEDPYPNQNARGQFQRVKYRQDAVCTSLRSPEASD